MSSYARMWMAAAGLVAGCGDSQIKDVSGLNVDDPGGDPPPAECAGDNGGITLPAEFCATVFADELGRARHMAVTPSGDVMVAIAPPRGTMEPGHVTALRDADHDGVAEVVQVVTELGGNGIAWADDTLYVAASDRIVAYALSDGALAPEGARVVISGLPATDDHTAKTVVPVGDSLYVNHGSASNACQVENRVLHSPGVDPCPELCVRAGIWKFSARKTDQVFDGSGRVATGLRNTNAMALAGDGTVWGAINGRDQLHENWPELFTEAQDLLLPGEDVVAIREGMDHGWPYCFSDPETHTMLLAPEYGGDGVMQGRCKAIEPPPLSMPAHWAPLGMAFYGGSAFPERFHGGAFIANHGSRFDANAVGNPGYNVVFVPFTDGKPGTWEEFATGFTGGGLPLPDAAIYRPVGVALMPDGALLISDDKVGRIWRVTYQAPEG
jgi:glucose/arabinose dehydrogenase